MAWTPAASTHPVPWLIGLLAVSIGVPFFAISATAPLLQRWFSRSDHPHASDPYFLYVSSNAGGLIALLAYPVLIEPLLGLTLQGRLWTAGYAPAGGPDRVLYALSLWAARRTRDRRYCRDRGSACDCGCPWRERCCPTRHVGHAGRAGWRWPSSPRPCCWR